MASKEGVKVVIALFVDATMRNYFHDFSLLVLAQTQFGDLLVSLDIVLRAHNSLKDSLFDICYHMLLLG
jgi:hypothetical protein